MGTTSEHVEYTLSTVGIWPVTSLHHVLGLLCDARLDLEIQDL